MSAANVRQRQIVRKWRLFTLEVSSGKVMHRPGVRPSISSFSILTGCIFNATHQGAARDAASVYFGPIITRTDVLVLLSLSGVIADIDRRKKSKKVSKWCHFWRPVMSAVSDKPCVSRPAGASMIYVYVSGGREEERVRSIPCRGRSSIQCTPQLQPRKYCD